MRGLQGRRNQPHDLTSDPLTAKYRPGLDTGELRQRLKVGSAPVILSNGRLVEQKGFPTLIKVLQLVRHEVRDATLVVIGKGPMRTELLSDRYLRRSMGQEARRRAVELSDWDVVVEAWDSSCRALSG